MTVQQLTLSSVLAFAVALGLKIDNCQGAVTVRRAVFGSLAAQFGRDVPHALVSSAPGRRVQRDAAIALKRLSRRVCAAR